MSSAKAPRPIREKKTTDKCGIVALADETSTNAGNRAARLARHRGAFLPPRLPRKMPRKMGAPNGAPRAPKLDLIDF